MWALAAIAGLLVALIGKASLEFEERPPSASFAQLVDGNSYVIVLGAGHISVADDDICGELLPLSLGGPAACMIQAGCPRGGDLWHILGTRTRDLISRKDVVSVPTANLGKCPRANIIVDIGWMGDRNPPDCKWVRVYERDRLISQAGLVSGVPDGNPQVHEWGAVYESQTVFYRGSSDGDPRSMFGLHLIQSGTHDLPRVGGVPAALDYSPRSDRSGNDKGKHLRYMPASVVFIVAMGLFCVGAYVLAKTLYRSSYTMYVGLLAATILIFLAVGAVLFTFEPEPPQIFGYTVGHGNGFRSNGRDQQTMP